MADISLSKLASRLSQETGYTIKVSNEEPYVLIAEDSHLGRVSIRFQMSEGMWVFKSWKRLSVSEGSEELSQVAFAESMVKKILLFLSDF